MQDETTVGFLKEAMSCVVTEERNGVFELTLTYPITGALFDKLQIDRFVKAKPNDTADLQIFRIYEVTKPMNGVVTVNAEHVSYARSNFPVNEINITGTATQAINIAAAGKLRCVRRQFQNGEISYRQAADLCNMSVTSFYRYCNGNCEKLFNISLKIVSDSRLYGTLLKRSRILGFQRFS